MTRQETLTILALLEAAYPQRLSRNVAVMANLWTELFADDDPNDVARAVKAYIATDTSGFPPSVGQIKQFYQTPKITEGEIVAAIMKASRNGIYGANEEFAKLPPEAQRVVGYPEQLREFAVMDETTLHGTVATRLAISARKMLESDRNQMTMLKAGNSLLE